MYLQTLFFGDAREAKELKVFKNSFRLDLSKFFFGQNTVL